MAGYYATWMELVCPECQAHNWINTSDVDEDFDPGTCCCWKCRCSFNAAGEVLENPEIESPEGLIIYDPRDLNILNDY